MSSKEFITSVFDNSNYSALTLINRIKYLSSLGLTKDTYRGILSNTSIIDSQKVNSMLTRAFHIIAFLKELPQSDETTELMTMYVKLIDDLKAKQKEQLLNNHRSENDRFIEIDTLQSLLKRNEPKLSLSMQKEENIALYKALENHVLLSMYINMHAVRNDYRNVHVIRNRTEINDHDNFIIVNNRGVNLVLNKFKTKKSFGQTKLQVDKESARLIRAMLKIRDALHFESNMLFNHVSRGGLSPITNDESMLMRIKYVSMKYFGTFQSINDFRHAWEVKIQSDPAYQKMTLKEREKEHAKLLHSTNTALTYNRV